jgi:hypothetical protein
MAKIVSNARAQRLMIRAVQLLQKRLADTVGLVFPVVKDAIRQCFVRRKKQLNIIFDCKLTTHPGSTVLRPDESKN